VTTPDPHSLAGAHVPHATADTERVAFERRRADRAACAHEVREFLKTTTWSTRSSSGRSALEITDLGATGATNPCPGTAPNPGHGRRRE
jgi:hypothetical protein